MLVAVISREVPTGFEPLAEVTADECEISISLPHHSGSTHRTSATESSRLPMRVVAHLHTQYPAPGTRVTALR